MYRKSGFTLIELLVVIAIIGVLASVVLASLSSARGRANDAKIRQDMHQMRTALQLYYNQVGSMPLNPIATHASPVSTALQPLVTQGFMSTIPTSPIPAQPYYYFNYGPGNDLGAMIVATFGATSPSTGYPGTCRPWPAGVNWCNADSSVWYCLCNPY